MTLHPGELEHPIVLAPMAGGPATIALAAAVSDAGGLGFLATGYRHANTVQEELIALRERTGGPFGVNLFVPQGAPAPEDVVAAYAARLCDAGIDVGEGSWDDDQFEAKVELVLEEQPAVASFTFGLPPPDVVLALHDRGVAVWVTVTHTATSRSCSASTTPAGGSPKVNDATAGRSSSASSALASNWSSSQ